jgi:flagellar protein FlgJ
MTAIGNLLSAASTTAERAETLADLAGAGDDASRKAVAAEFEALFVSLLLKEMRQTVGGDGLFPGESSDVYGGLFDLYLGKHVAHHCGLGIERMVATYLSRAKPDNE